MNQENQIVASRVSGSSGVEERLRDPDSLIRPRTILPAPNNFRHFHYMAVLCFLWLAVACNPHEGLTSSPRDRLPHAHSPEYNWVFYNASSEELYSAGITWNSAGYPPFTAGSGYLTPSATAFDTEGWDPIPNSVQLHWAASTQPSKTKIIEVGSKIDKPEEFGGTIWFIFDGQDWHVLPQKGKVYEFHLPEFDGTNWK